MMSAVAETLRKILSDTIESLLHPVEVLSPADYAQIVSEDEELRKMLMPVETLCKTAYELAGKKPSREDIRTCVAEFLKDALEGLGLRNPEELRQHEDKVMELVERVLKRLK